MTVIDALPLGVPDEAVAALDEMADEHPNYRFELTPEGLIEAEMTPVSTHSRIISMLMFWLTRKLGDDPLRVRTEVGVVTHRAGRSALRRPDIAVFREPPPDGVQYLEPGYIQVVVEVTSRSTEKNDFGPKVVEYAGSGIPHYWVVDAHEQVHMYVRDPVTGYDRNNALIVPLQDLLDGRAKSTIEDLFDQT